MTYIEIDRARSLIAQHDLDGLLVVSAENFECLGFFDVLWGQSIEHG